MTSASPRKAPISSKTLDLNQFRFNDDDESKQNKILITNKPFSIQTNLSITRTKRPRSTNEGIRLTSTATKDYDQIEQFDDDIIEITSRKFSQSKSRSKTQVYVASISFPPLLPDPSNPFHNQQPHTLILGSHPSVASLEQKQYYAFRYNTFWEIMRNLCAEIEQKNMNVERTSENDESKLLYKHGQNEIDLTTDSFSNSQKSVVASTDWKSYETRCSVILHFGFILWDVIAACERVKSSDSLMNVVHVNPILEVVRKFPSIHVMAFNGGTAFTNFNKHFKHEFNLEFPHIRLIQVPSTSPAHAVKDPIKTKTEKWKKLLILNEESYKFLKN